MSGGWIPPSRREMTPIPTGKPCFKCGVPATMICRVLLTPGKQGDEVHVCQEHFKDTLPELPPEPQMETLLSKESLVRSLEKVANEYGCNGTTESNLIADAFRRLIVEIES